MKKIFKTVALATALAVGAATFSGCTSPLDPTGEDPTNGGSNGGGSSTNMITLALSKNTADPNDIETKRAITTGLDMTINGTYYTFPREVVFEASQFESGKTYYVEGTAGRDHIYIVDGYGDRVSKRFNIVSKGVKVSNGSQLSTINVDVEMPVKASTGVPLSPYTNLSAVSGVKSGEIITGTKMLIIEKANGSYYRL